MNKVQFHVIVQKENNLDFLSPVIDVVAVDIYHNTSMSKMAYASNAEEKDL